MSFGYQNLDTEQICWPDAQLSSLDLVKLEELLALGKVPSQPSLCALILITIHSHKLTPQLDDQDPTYWPAGYMADRHLAQTAAKMLLKLVVHDQKIKETYEEMAQDLDAILSKIPFDRCQQDLLDPSESNVGFQHQQGPFDDVLVESLFLKDKTAPFGSRDYIY